MSSTPKKPSGFISPAAVLSNYTIEDKGGFITQEFQDFAYRLAMTLNDEKHKSLYMRLTKNTSRGILENALSFVLDAASAKNKAALFMWKVKKLKDEEKARNPNQKLDQKTPPEEKKKPAAKKAKKSSPKKQKQLLAQASLFSQDSNSSS